MSFLFQGARGIWEPDEGRYTAATMEMIFQRDVIHPVLHHERPHYTKPPLTYWAIAGSVLSFGYNEWAVRFPNGLAFFLTTTLIYVIGLSLVPQRPWLPALIYATSLLPVVASNVVTADTLLTLWEVLGVTGFVLSRSRGGATLSKSGLAIMWLGFSLAFLTKGPPGLLPLVSIFAFVWLAEGRRKMIRLLWFPGPALFLLVGCSWYGVVVYQRPELLGYFFNYELISRMFTGVHNRGAAWYEGFTIYVPVLVLGALPWAYALVPAARALRILLRPREWRRRMMEEREASFLLLWFFLPLAVFFLAQSRSELYVLPLMAPLAISLARILQSRFELRVWNVVLLAGWILLLIGMRWAGGMVQSDKDSRQFARAIRQLRPVQWSEIVFFRQRPRYGLTLYLRAEVEYVDDLAEELAEQETMLLWVVPSDSRAEFIDEAAGLHRQVRELGEYREDAFFEIDPPN